MRGQTRALPTPPSPGVLAPISTLTRGQGPSARSVTKPSPGRATSRCHHGVTAIAFGKPAADQRPRSGPRPPRLRQSDVPPSRTAHAGLGRRRRKRAAGGSRSARPTDALPAPLRARRAEGLAPAQLRRNYAPVCPLCRHFVRVRDRRQAPGTSSPTFVTTLSRGGRTRASD